MSCSASLILVGRKAQTKQGDRRSGDAALGESVETHQNFTPFHSLFAFEIA